MPSPNEHGPNLKMKPPPPKTQPPPPIFSPPVASYRSARREELDALRQKGLAKIFNRHFTSVADKIRQEREAAELALQEIVKRKAELAENPKCFKEGGLTLTQLDKLHMELKKRKNEVQRKERETQELYKRYCSQYGGDTEYSFADVALWKKATSGLGLTAVHEGTDEGYHSEDMVRQSDLARAREADVARAGHYANVNKLASEIEENQAAGQRGCEADGVTHPDKGTGFVNTRSFTTTVLSPPPPSGSGSSLIPDAVAPSAKITPIKGEQNHRQGPLKLNESGLDATAASTPTPAESPSVQGNASVMDRSLYFAKFDDREDDDDDSAVSGLTDIDGVTVAEAEWKLTEFLRTETENIKKMLRNEPLDLDAVEEDDNYSIFTYNRSLVSGESDRVGRAAREAEEMVARMAEATAWMNDPTLLENETDSEEEEEDGNHDDELNPICKVEWTAYWSADHQREYYHNSVTHQTCWTKPLDVEIDYSHVEGAKQSSNSSTASANSSSVNIRMNVSMISPAKTVHTTITKLDSPPSGEKVAVKDFTNKSSKGPSPEALSASKYTNDHAIKSLRPTDASDENSDVVCTIGSPAASSVTSLGMSSRSSTTTSKVMQYRRKRARIARRNRRLGIAVLSTIVLGAVYYYKNYQVATPGPLASSSKGVNLNAEKKLELAKKLAAADAERKRLLEQKRLEEEALKQRQVEEEQAKKKKEEEEEALKRRKEEEALKKRQEELEKLRLQAEEEKRRQEAMQMVLREEEERMQLQLLQEEMRRPWACNIPLTYLMSRKCWKVAKLNPIYDCKALTDIMLE